MREFKLIKNSKNKFINRINPVSKRKFESFKTLEGFPNLVYTEQKHKKFNTYQIDLYFVLGDDHIQLSKLNILDKTYLNQKQNAMLLHIFEYADLRSFMSTIKENNIDTLVEYIKRFNVPYDIESFKSYMAFSCLTSINFMKFINENRELLSDNFVDKMNKYREEEEMTILMINELNKKK